MEVIAQIIDDILRWLAQTLWNWLTATIKWFFAGLFATFNGSLRRVGIAPNPEEEQAQAQQRFFWIIRAVIAWGIVIAIVIAHFVNKK